MGYRYVDDYTHADGEAGHNALVGSTENEINNIIVNWENWVVSHRKHRWHKLLTSKRRRRLLTRPSVQIDQDVVSAYVKVSNKETRITNEIPQCDT